MRLKGKILLSVMFTCCSIVTTWTQIQLSIPANADTLEESEPNLVWQTYTSFLNDPRYSLTLTVVEVEENQTPTEALIENVPVLFRENLIQNSFTLSSNELTLSKNVWYAWQINLLFMNVPTQQSEVWRFILTDPILPIPNCIALRRSVDNSIYYLNGEELLLSTDETKISNLKAYLIDAENQRFEIELIAENNVSNSDLKVFKLNVEALDLNGGQYRFEWSPNRKISYQFKLEK